MTPRGWCEVCQKMCPNPAMVRPAVQAHHVVYQQELARRSLSRDDKRDLMPICRECHERHHSGGPWRIPLEVLRDDHYEYAFEKLGAYAFDYLRARYSGEDERLAWWLAKEDPVTKIA